MSRIGKKPIEIPEGVTVNIDGQKVNVKGKLGELSLEMLDSITIEQEDKLLVLKRKSEIKAHRALHGLYRALIANMVTGVSEGFNKVLEIKGVGYRADMKGDKLVLQLGHSHPIEFSAPEGITIEVDKQNNVTISGINKERVGQVAADIRAYRPPDAYKGKGVRYRGEKVKLKPGKSGV